MEEVDEVELVVQRVAALDLGKATWRRACGCRTQVSRGGGCRRSGAATTTAALLEMAIWLRQWGIERVVMESTSDYWKGVYYLLEAEGFDCWLVNAREVKNVPGRAKTIALMRCGWRRWPSAACAARRWCTRRRSAGCAI